MISTPGTFPLGSKSSQMLPPSSLPLSQINSPALYLRASLPSPTNSVAPSPQLSALSFPLINAPPPPTTPYISQQVELPSWGNWSQDTQKKFKIQIARLTAAAGLPFSWVDNPEWVDFIHLFLPAAKSPSQKVLTTRLIPQVSEEYRKATKESSRDQNATIQADGWMGANFHHLLTFMIAIKKVRSVTHWQRQRIIPTNQTCQTHTVNVHDASCECKTAENLKIHLENAIHTVRVDYVRPT